MLQLRMGVLNLVHELMHSFGAKHDPEQASKPECTPDDKVLGVGLVVVVGFQYAVFIINPHSHPTGFYWGHHCSWTSPPSQQHAGLHHAVWRLQQEVTRPKARFKPTSAINVRCQHAVFQPQQEP